MILKLHKGLKIILETPVQTLSEFYKLIYYLQSTFSGTADCYLWEDNKIIKALKLGQKPCRVYNSALGEWKPFEEFYNNPFSFAFCDRMLHAYWIRDKLILSLYGFQ